MFGRSGRAGTVVEEESRAMVVDDGLLIGSDEAAADIAV